jgi:hypothetical protein
MARRTRSIRDLRAEAEAIERLGLNTPPVRKPRSEPTERRPKPESHQKMKVVWAVRDIGGRTVKTFDYPEKALAEEFAAELKAKGKGNHFVSSEKVPM